MPRNRQQTEARIIEAARSLIHREGFSGWGINPLAREAGCDKVLLYRYFDSLEGILSALLKKSRFWPDPETLPESSPEAFFEETARFLRQRPELGALLTLPQAAGPFSPIQRAHAADLEQWVGGLRARSRGSLSDARWQQLAALLFFQALTGEERVGPRELWGLVSPPLEWGAAPPAYAEDDLPPELL